MNRKGEFHNAVIAYENEIMVDPLIEAAARLVERLLPGECENCKGTGSTFDDPNCYACTCPVCHGSGRVWDEGIVEAVAKAIYELRWGTHEWDRLPPAGIVLEDVKYQARLVLSALVELLTGKVER